MSRWLLWAVTGLVLGGIIHIVVILTLPSLAATSAWDRIGELSPAGGFVTLPAVGSDAPNPLGLDPQLTYAACRVDLRNGPATVTGNLPRYFWSVAVYNRAGTIVYSTTNRDSVGTRVDLGIFNPAQTRLLAEQRLDIAEGLLIVEAREDDLMVVVRLAPPHSEMRARYETALGRLSCGNIPT